MVHLAAHGLGPPWVHSRGRDWLGEVLAQLPVVEGAAAVSLASLPGRSPAGVLGRPGPRRGNPLRAPCGSDLFDRCRSAADLLTFAVERRGGL